MKLEDGCYALKLECAIRDVAYVDMGWRCVAHSGLYFIQPYGLPDIPQGNLLGFSVIKQENYSKASGKVVRLSPTARKALDFAQSS